MLIDEATIYVRGGKGGDGCLSFRREKFIPKGGPDGGDGGDGGNVVLVGDRNINTLLNVSHRPHKRAENGTPGRGKSMHGARGQDCLVPIPLGTLIHDADTGHVFAEINADSERVVVAHGGKGGFGNEHFKSATNQTPREYTGGEDGEERTLRLVLKLIADVGLVGLPNAGKSTLLRAVSRATPKVADYPFTTLAPHLGIAELPFHPSRARQEADSPRRRGGRGGKETRKGTSRQRTADRPSAGRSDRTLVMADIPGLIAGAAEGAGLGHEFLRHVERTSVLVHVVDAMPMDGSDPVENYRTIRSELSAYGASLSEKPEIIAVNKIDLLPEDERGSMVTGLAEQLARTAGETAQSSGERPSVVAISGATGLGLAELLERCWRAVGAETSEPRDQWPRMLREENASGGAEASADRRG